MKDQIIGAIILVVFLALMANCFSCFGCGGCGGCGGNDGVCDDAGCTRSATTTFGGMELCLKHYIEWSDRARN